MYVFNTLQPESEKKKVSSSTSRNSLPSKPGNYYLTQNVTISSTWNVPGSGTTNLCLNGYGIRMTGSNQRVISIVGGAVLTLKDSGTSRTHKFTVDSNTHLATLDEENGTLTINGGYITGGNFNDYGGGIFVGANSTFNLDGGTIIGNRCTRNHGGGILVDRIGGYGTFNMNGGVIRNNYSSGVGGAMFLNGYFTMNGGLITQNYANSSGDGIFAQNGTQLCEINGGSISGNFGDGIVVSTGKTIKLGKDAMIENNGDIDIKAYFSLKVHLSRSF